MVDFAEKRINTGFDYGTNFGPRFQTTVKTKKNGFEYINRDWSRRQKIGDIGSRRVMLAMKDYLEDFFYERMGMSQYFRYRDLGDYRVVDEPLTFADLDTEIQLIKTYGEAPYAYVQNITKPCALTEGGDTGYKFDPITIKRDGVLEAGWTLDTTTGLVTLAAPANAGEVFTWSGEFDTPVRFDSDYFPRTLKAYREDDHMGFFDLPPLPIVEMKQ